MNLTNVIRDNFRINECIVCVFQWLQGKKRRDVKSIDYEQSFRNVEDHGEIYTRRNFYRLLERHLEM